MQLLWILSPLAQFSFLAITVIVCLALSLSLKREIDVVRRSSRDAAAASATALAAGLATLKREQENENREPPVVTGQDLNLTRRAQALRMQRRGEPAPTIAAALRIPRNEVDLLLKVQKLVNEREQSTAGEVTGASRN
jgi:hypothetical protein